MRGWEPAYQPLANESDPIVMWIDMIRDIAAADVRAVGSYQISTAFVTTIDLGRTRAMDLIRSAFGFSIANS